MDQDWDAVAKAISDRIAELGIRQRDLADRANVGLSTVQELVNNWKPRKRNPKTLAAISEALGWPPGKIQAVADGRPDELSEPSASSLAAHSRDVVQAVEALLQKLGGASPAEELGKLHDAGKSAPGVQDSQALQALADRVKNVEERLAAVESQLNNR